MVILASLEFFLVFRHLDHGVIFLNAMQALSHSIHTSSLQILDQIIRALHWESRIFAKTYASPQHWDHDVGAMLLTSWPRCDVGDEVTSNQNMNFPCPPGTVMKSLVSDDTIRAQWYVNSGIILNLRPANISICSNNFILTSKKTSVDISSEPAG